MKAFLLAAGEGRRLRPLTDALPKCLVPIRSTPLLGIWLQLFKTHGIDEALVNLHHLPDQVSEFLRSFQAGPRVQTVHEPRLLGSAGTVLANRDFVKGERRFLIVYADNLTTIDLRRMIRFHDTRREPLTLGVAPTDRPQEKGTVRIGAQGEVTEFAEKAEHPPSNLANIGIYVATQELFDFMPASVPEGGVVDFGFDVLPRMVPRIAAYRVDDYLIDVGTHAAYQQAERTWPGLPAPDASRDGHSAPGSNGQ